MENYFEPALSEEQLAAYLDGMLSTEDSSLVEDVIASDPQMQEIQDSLDAVDTAYIDYDPTMELPVEVMADDFTLPEVYGDYDHDGSLYADDVYDDDGYAETGYNAPDEYDESLLSTPGDDPYGGDGFDDISF